MRLSTDAWDDLVSMTKAAIMTWQSTAEARGLPDRFTVIAANKEGRTALLTRQVVNGREVKARCIMRFADTGSVFPCKFDKKAGKWKPTPAPHRWVAADGKPLTMIWKLLRLVEFTLLPGKAMAA